ncbi:hypothetical protein [Rossellomorea marisflavi]|uniref:hypothetical protein n=1 Tax=Rossellomorea marisflavi TaxID=189381 RepID=UPI00356247E6
MNLSLGSREIRGRLRKIGGKYAEKGQEVATIGLYIADCTLSSTVYPRRGYLLLNTVMTDPTASQEGEVKEVLEKIFTGPDVELKSLMDQ